jgi:hypothetical protein
MKHEGQMLSMGYGFIEFQFQVALNSLFISRSSRLLNMAAQEDALKAIKELQGSLLDGHALQLKFSQRDKPVTAKKYLGPAVSSPHPCRRQRKEAGDMDTSNKLMVKNLAFEATQNELRGALLALGSQLTHPCRAVLRLWRCAKGAAAEESWRDRPSRFRLC